MADGAEAGGDDAASDEADNKKMPNHLDEQRLSKAPKVHYYAFEVFKKDAMDILPDTDMDRDGDVYLVVVQEPKLDSSGVASHVKQIHVTVSTSPRA